MEELLPAAEVLRPLNSRQSGRRTTILVQEARHGLPPSLINPVDPARSAEMDSRIHPPLPHPPPMNSPSIHITQGPRFLHTLMIQGTRSIADSNTLRSWSLHPRYPPAQSVGKKNYLLSPTLVNSGPPFPSVVGDVEAPIRLILAMSRCIVVFMSLVTVPPV